MLLDLVMDFKLMCEVEGVSFLEILENQILDIVDLMEKFVIIVEVCKDEMKVMLQVNFVCVLENIDGVDENCVVQELVIMVVKSDVIEEIDCLKVYVGVVCDFIVKGSLIG